MPSSPSTDRVSGRQPGDLSRKYFDEFSRLVRDKVGIEISDAKRSMLEGRLAMRVRQLGLATLADYRHLLFESPAGEGELVHFIDAVTTNKTDFFREPKHFDCLLEQVLPGHDETGRFQVWSAACSTGEEPYTLAMALSEYSLIHPAFDFAILATDVSARVLAHARTGIYDASRIDGIPEPLRRRYLLRSRDRERPRFRIAPDLRRRVSFHRMNLMDPVYAVRDRFDAIFLRNVLIYFSAATQAAVVGKLCERLRPGGHLFVGHSESVIRLEQPFKQVAAAVYRKSGTEGSR